MLRSIKEWFVLSLKVFFRSFIWIFLFASIWVLFDSILNKPDEPEPGVCNPENFVNTKAELFVEYTKEDDSISIHDEDLAKYAKVPNGGSVIIECSPKRLEK